MNQYTQRQPINRKAFAFRHMILEEIKYRKLSKNLSANRIAILDKISRGIRVTFVVSQKFYEIFFQGGSFKKVGNDQIVLFLRGDNDAGKRSQLELEAKQDQLSDAILKKNRDFVKDLVDELESKFSNVLDDSAEAPL